jgi:pimeloyl-ACP methyl ester carboxylesterase
MIYYSIIPLLCPLKHVISSYSMASPHRLLPLKVPTLLAIGTADADVPPDMLISFHKEAVEAHKLLKNDVEKGGVCGKSAVLEMTPSLAPHSSTPSVSEPTLLLIDNADHYKILDASESAWLELFASIEIQLQLQL